MAAIHLYRTAERPDLELWLEDDSGTLVDLSAHTLEFKLGHPGAAAVFTKTTGVAGAVGSGTEDSGTPNVTVTFSAGDLNGVSSGSYTWQVKATLAGADRFWQGPLVLHDVIT